ncbi:hypothetical protein CE91St62_36610 [Lachnospiraceae bacterium]|nr:hypothetical protein CE91St61_36730 [Lachnospiraceae bacterium]BDF39600.1 hypothetical protein CE91St62_36610 [Lachnospiraceae bacterium]
MLGEALVLEVTSRVVDEVSHAGSADPELSTAVTVWVFLPIWITFRLLTEPPESK